MYKVTQDEKRRKIFFIYSSFYARIKKKILFNIDDT